MMEISAAKENAEYLEHSNCLILSWFCIPHKYFILIKRDKIASIISYKGLYEMSLKYWEWSTIGSGLK